MENNSKVNRPRMSEREVSRHNMYKDQKKSVYKVCIASDFHGFLVDEASLNAFIQMISHNDFDEIVLNGDIIDFPYLSSHVRKLYEGSDAMKGYSEVGEIEFVKKNIIIPIVNSSNGAKVVYRIGNHEERVTSPKRYGKEQSERLNELYQHYNTTKLDEMLCLEELGVEYDPTPIRNYGDIFEVVHGLSLSKNAPEKNIYQYMGSGCSGHSHRLNQRYITNRNSSYVWLESGCMRVIDNVEYLPTATIPDWTNGFVTVYFDCNEDGVDSFFAETHPIINGKCRVNGVIYGN